MVLQDFHCSVEKYYRVASKNCSSQALNSDVYPISHIPEISNPIENRHSAAKWGWKKKWEWKLVGDAAIIIITFYCLLKTFNWRIIDLQCCAGFNNAISHMHPCIPFLWPSLPHPTHLGRHRALG